MKKLIAIVFILTATFYMNVNAMDFKADICNLSLPVIDWSLTIDLNGFRVKGNDIRPAGNSRGVLAVNDDLHTTVSVYIEPAEHDWNNIECRKYFWDKILKSPYLKENVIQYEKSNMAFVEHDIKEIAGQEINHHSMHAYMVKDDYWIIIHISKILYTAADKSIFDDIINSVKIETPKIKNDSELFLFGVQAYLAKDYKNAISSFEDMLATEQEKINIDKTIWTIVVDDLGMAYGITGDLDNSQRIFEYGIRLDPDYPMFYYNLACAYAEKSDFDNALAQLEIAYSKKDNVLEGEEMPNPRTDSSFEKYKDEKRFKAFLKKNGL